jgi:hypothetical protein
MRIYEGSPRQDFEEVLRSIGAFLDKQGMRDILLVEVPDGFIVQGIVTAGSASSAWSETVATVDKETFSFLDDDIAKFMEECLGRRGSGDMASMKPGYERALRVIGRWMDEQHPRDIFLLEQDGAFVIRLLLGGQAGARHQLAEFTHEDVEQLLQQAPAMRARPIGQA